MITYNLSKKDIRKVAGQFYFSYIGRLLILVGICAIGTVYGLISYFLLGEQNSRWSIAALALIGICFVIFIAFYIICRFQFSKCGTDYTINYESNVVCINNLTKAKIYELQIAEITVIRKLKSFLILRFTVERKQILIVPLNEDTKPFVQLFSTEQTK